MVASISAVSSAAAGASYYGKDNYYAKGRDEPDPSSWSGRGAKALGLSGPVDIKTFERVLAGETLDGRRVGQRSGESLEQAMARTHRPGVDLTFSPPKDVSLLLYLGGDRRIAHAHGRAVDQTLKWAERNMAGTRIRMPAKDGADTKGRVVPVKTGNLVIAKFEHDISRDRDPQLHTHSIIANMTRGPDGKWRALHNDPLFAHRKTLSLAYDAAMREQMRDLGYQVTLTDGKTGAYQIEGVPEAARDAFSQGRSRIDQVMEKLDNDTPAIRGKVAVKTRPTKTQMTAEEKRAEWEARAAPWSDQLKSVAARAERQAEAGRRETLLDASRPERSGLSGAVKRAAQNLFRPSHTVRLERDDPYKMDRAGSEQEVAARSAVSHALRQIEEREAAFSVHTVRRHALEHGADGLTLSDVDKELRLIRRSGKLMVNAGDPGADATTRRSLSNEERTHKLVRGAGKTAPLVDPVALGARLSGSGLTPGQQAAIAAILSGNERLVGVQGYAGTGKTTMMRQAASLAGDLKSLSGKKDLTVRALAPTHATVRALNEGAGFEAETVQSFMSGQARGTGPTSLKGEILVIDEASFVSTRNMNQVLDRALKLKPERIVLAGDRRQHGAVEAGRPFDIAQRAGMRTAVMKDVVRLPDDREHSDQRQAVLAAGEGQVRRAMARIKSNLTEAPPGLKGEALDAWMAGRAAATWTAWREETGSNPMAIAQGHAMRRRINAEIRHELVQRGDLGSEAIRIGTKLSKNLTRAEALSPRSYRRGDVLWFNSRVDRLGASAGHQRTVVDIDEANGRVTLESARGRKTVALSSLVGRRDYVPFSVNETASIELREKDELLFTRTHKDHDIAALDRATVLGFDDKTVRLDMDGKVRVFERTDPALQGLTHAYAVNSHAGQGKTASDVITVQDSREKMLASQVGFYVDISRSADRLEVVTDDAERLTGALERNTGLKSSALETAARMEAMTGLDEPPRSDPEMGEAETSQTEKQSQDEIDMEPADQEVEAPDLDQDMSM